MQFNPTKLTAHIACALPQVWMVYAILQRQLGGDPQKALLHLLGLWGLIFLLGSLTVTPLRKLCGISGLIRYRRMLGLWAAFYLILHFLVFFWLFVDFSTNQLLLEVSKRPYITLGMAGLIMLLPLVLTSTKAMQKRLGRSWKKLHRLVYLIAICGVIHFIWQSKSDLNEPLWYLIWLVLVLGYRIWDGSWMRSRPAQSN